MKKYLCLFVGLLMLNGCSYWQAIWPFGEEKTAENQTQEASVAEKTDALKVNPYLWQASLEKLSFMPLASSDGEGGVIVTDWKTFSNNEQFKVVVHIYSQKLQANSLKVDVYKRRLKNGAWVDDAVDNRLSEETEKAILMQARELYHRDVMTR